VRNVVVYTGYKYAKIFSSYVNVELKTSVSGIPDSTITGLKISPFSIITDPDARGDL
jgi:hypothetical protein